MSRLLLGLVTLLLLTLGFVWFPVYSPSVPVQEPPAVAPEPAYGFDRLSPQDAAAEGSWLPEVEVTRPAGSAGTGFSLDQVLYDDWLAARGYLQLAGPVQPTLPLNTAGPLWIIRPEARVLPVFNATVEGFAPFRELTYGASLPALAANCDGYQTSVILLTTDETWAGQSLSQDALRDFAAQLNLVVVHEGIAPPPALSVPVVWLRKDQPIVQALAGQLLFGALPGGLPGSSLSSVAERIGHAPPEWAGMDRTALARIDALAQRAIDREATPGCQVLVVKNGAIVYDRSFGHHTYQEEQEVHPQDLYDLASITKAAATTLGVMSLVEDGRVALADRLRDHLPEYRRSGIRYLRVRHLLAHQTGLQANLPVAHWLNKPAPFLDSPVDEAIPLAPSVYLPAGEREDMLQRITRLPLRHRSRYRYGDVHFVLLQQLVEHYYGRAMDSVLRDRFYGPMGLHRLAFRPGLVFPAKELVPSAKDGRWRHKELRGEVHDEGASLLGGVAGNAGLFANSRDLASLFQMLLWQGRYGGQQWLEPATITTFTQRNGYNYRAFGFDRLAGHSRKLQQYGASRDAFGHTGFTGGCVWADPEHDLIYVFLSNRTYPDPKNNRLLRLGTRERIHQLIYQSLGTYDPEA
ncbi:MAG: serine hydrolase [Lewinella sp.]|nr:serine hydrolase [Lewinella sp.]